MLGIHDFWIWSAYLLCLISAAVCVVYGLYNWNRGSEDETQGIHEERKLEKVDQKT